MFLALALTAVLASGPSDVCGFDDPSIGFVATDCFHADPETGAVTYDVEPYVPAPAPTTAPAPLVVESAPVVVEAPAPVAVPSPSAHPAPHPSSQPAPTVAPVVPDEAPVAAPVSRFDADRLPWWRRPL